MRPYKRQKLGMLVVIAMMGISGTVFAAEPQIISSNNSTDKIALISVQKNPSLKMKKDSSVSSKKYQKKNHKKINSGILPL